MERHIWFRHPYVAYLMVDKARTRATAPLTRQFLNPFTLLAGPALVIYLTVKSSRDPGPDAYHLPAWNILLRCISSRVAPLNAAAGLSGSSPRAR